MDSARRHNLRVQIGAAERESHEGLEKYYLMTKDRAATNPYLEEYVLCDYRKHYEELWKAKRLHSEALERIIEHIENRIGQGTTTVTMRTEDEHEIRRVRAELGEVRQRMEELSDLLEN